MAKLGYTKKGEVINVQVVQGGLFTVVVALGNINLLPPEIIHASPTLQWNAIMLVQRIKIVFTCHDICN